MTIEEPFYLGAYWGARADPVDVCADRLADCLARVGRCSPLCSSWFTKPSRRQDAGGVISADVDALSDLLVGGVNRRDVDGSPIKDLGFSLGLWNGAYETPIGLSVTCGSWAATPGVMNSFVLDLPAPGEASELYDLSTALCLMRAVADVWEPDWATLTSHGLADALDVSPREPSVGWLTYLCETRPVPPSAPVALREDLPRGTLLAVADQVADVDVATVRTLADALHHLGGLAPTP